MKNCDLISTSLMDHPENLSELPQEKHDSPSNDTFHVRLIFYATRITLIPQVLMVIVFIYLVLSVFPFIRFFVNDEELLIHSNKPQQ